MSQNAVTWGELGDLYDGPHATPVRRSEGPYFLNIASLSNGRLDLAASDHVSPQDFKRWTRRVTPRVGDLLFSYETRLGEAASMPDGVEACLGRRMALLRPDLDVVDPKYLLYFYLSPEFQRTIARHTIHGATVPRIGLATMPTWPVTVPELATQRAIAEVLGALDNKITANSATESSCDALMGELVAKYQVNAPLQRFFDAFDVDFGEPFSGSNFCEPGVGRPLIRIRDLKTFKSQVWTTETRPRETVVSPGEVVVGMDAEFRPSWWLGSDGLLNQRVCRVKGKNSGPAFVGIALRHPLSAIEGEKSGTTVIHLNKADLMRVKVRVPAGAAAAELWDISEPILAVRVRLARERNALVGVRDELLPLLMSGKVRVKDVEQVAEGVL